MAEQATTKATAAEAEQPGLQKQEAPAQPAGDADLSESTPAKTDASAASAAKGDDSTPTATAAAKGKDKETTGAAQQDSLLIERPVAAEPAATSTAAVAVESTPSQPSPAALSSTTAAHPTCNITLLLPTGARHPYKIDERYLTKRNVEIPDLTEDGKRDPFSISVYKLKELILREWREEWEGKPASPTSIRLIHFGRLLDDKEQLKRYQFSTEAPNVIHMSVRPAEMMEEEEGAKGKTSGSGGRTREGGSCCVIL